MARNRPRRAVRRRGRGLSSHLSAGTIEIGIGRELFEIRVKQGLSIEDVAERTKIREQLIKAIELEDYDEIPQDVGGIGLIATYARFLNLDAEHYLVQLEELWELQDSPRVVPEVGRRTKRGRWISVAFGTFGIILILSVLGYVLSDQYNAFLAQEELEQETTRIAPVDAARSILPTPAETRLPGMLPTQAVEEAPTPPPATHTPVPTEVSIELRANGRAWVQVTVDGNVSFSGIMDDGDIGTWIGRESIHVWAGNSGDLTVIYNGRNIGSLGQPGEVVRTEWSASGAQ